MPAYTRLLLAAWVAALALLTLPQIAGANPGTGPGLVQRSGTFVILHADGRSGGSTRQPMLANGLHETPVRAPDGVWIEPGSRVRVQGTMQAGTFVLADSLTAVRQLAASPNAAIATSAAPSIETTAVVMFYFQGQTAGALPAVSTADAMMNTGPSSLRAYYLEQTYGQVAFQADVLAPVQLAEPAPVTGDCRPAIFDWAQEAFSLTPSFDPSLYRHIVFVFPALPRAVCSWSGVADVGGSNVWINGAFSVAALAHELGHNLGLGHAGGLTCSSSGAPAPVGDSCSIDRQNYNSAGVLPQYADPFDAMGNAPVLRQMNMEHKLALGVLPDTAVQTVGASGTYRLAPMETLGTSVELLVLPKPGGGNYFLEYRQPAGFFDSQAGPPAAGVLIHTESPDLADPLSAFYADSDTALIDMHPDGVFASGQWQDAAMSVGQVFDDAANNIKIQELAEDASGASLAITLSLDTQPPSSPGALTAVASGTAVALTWTAASDDSGIDSYRVERDGAAIGAPAETGFTDTGLAPGATVDYAVTAVDTSGNLGPAATVAVKVPDTVAPSAPVNVRAAVTRDGQVHIAWGASKDNVAVTSYRILRAGTVIARVNVKAYVDRTPRAGPGTTVTYSVVALDAAGNTSPASAAEPLRAALLRKLGALRLTVSRAKAGKLVRVQGMLSDAKAVCRVRLDRGAWRGCKITAGGAFSANLRGKGARRVTVYLRDELGRVKSQTLPVP